MNVEIKNLQLVSVEYPGIVENTERMLETLGGLTRINKVFNDPSQRLDLRFRPDDAFCKCVHADRFNTTNLLLKIVRKKTNLNQTPADAANSIVKIEVVGKIETTFKFRCLADFQYLPIVKSEENKYSSLLSKTVPTGLVSTSWLQEECPLLILPPIFSRLDTPAGYHFRREPVKRHSENPPLNQEPSDNIIGRARAKRSGIGQYINYDETVLPCKPTQQAQEKLIAKGHYRASIEKTEQAFKERPIWSRSALAGNLKIDSNYLKKILPCVAYYFLNGPWRGLWVRFGYDPKKDPSAIKYQLLDLRLNITPGLGIKFSYKRCIHQYKISTKISNPQRNMVSPMIQAQSLNKSVQNDESNEFVNQEPEFDFTLRYIYREGELPPYRQTFYQLCDIQSETVQNLLGKEKGTAVCKEKEGWCSPNFIEKCRDILLKDAKKTAERLKKEYCEKLQNKDALKDEQQEELLADEEYEDMEIMSDLEEEDYVVEQD